MTLEELFNRLFASQLIEIWKDNLLFYTGDRDNYSGNLNYQVKTIASNFNDKKSLLDITIY